MPWLLDTTRPNLHWRALTDLIHRPPGSPAVVRAGGGANAVDPVASLIEDLAPDGTWLCQSAPWESFSGPGWRLLAAVQWGADATDPRLYATAKILLEEAPGSGGFALGDGQAPSPWLTARVLQALSVLGWCRNIRFQEAVAWLDEKAPRSVDGGWLRSGEGNHPGACEVTPVALLDALTTCGSRNRDPLRERSAASVRTNLVAMGEGMFVLGHPNFDRTDAAESFAVLARAGLGWDPEVFPALVRLQGLQLEGGRWPRGDDVPESLPIGSRPLIGEPSRWISLAAATAVLEYAVEAGLPRMFPRKPS